MKEQDYYCWSLGRFVKQENLFMKSSGWIMRLGLLGITILFSHCFENTNWCDSCYRFVLDE